MKNRREHLKQMAAFLALPALGGVALAADPLAHANNLKLDVRGGQPGRTMPLDFAGVSFESSKLREGKMFTPRDPSLLAIFQELGPKTVLRIGGNTSAFTTWAGDPDNVPKEVLFQTNSGGTEKGTVVTPYSIDQLAAFLDACDWRLIYGLNLANATLESTIAEALYVRKAVGSRLIAFQLGNEPDYFFKAVRPANYEFHDYLGEWKRMADGLMHAIPEIRFAGPDIASHTLWVPQFAKAKPANVVLLSGHYYEQGPPTSPNATIQNLLTSNKVTTDKMRDGLDAAKQSGLPYRMTEGNACYGGGKPGVSTVFASALWTCDYMLQCAQEGCVGVNFHGGGVLGTPEKGYTKAPQFDGIVMGSKFAGATFLNTAAETTANATGYAARRGQTTLAAVINKDNYPLALDFGRKDAPTRSWILSGAAVTSSEGVTFQPGTLTSVKGKPVLPAFSAVLLEWA